MPPGSPNPDLISDQKKFIFQTRFQTWPLTGNYVSITYIRVQTEMIPQIRFEFAYFSFFLTHLELKR